MADTWTTISGYTPQDYTDTAVFEVNSDTKKIALITGQALVAGEENSQYIKFVLDRYWDGIDIKDKAFYVEYALAGTYYGKTAAVNAEYNTEQVRFGWIVPKEACCISGTLLFVLRIESTDYVLKTQIAEHPVFKSVNVEDVVPEPTKEAWYRDFEARVETAIDDAETALTAAQAAQTAAENAALNAQTSEENAETAAAMAQTRYGSPLTAAEADEMIEQNRVYVYVGNETGYTYGHWYYYNGTEWADGGAYNGSAVNTDTTLTQSGMAADAKATGDEINQIKEDLQDETKIIFIKSGSTNSSGTIVYGNCTAIVGDKIGLIDLGMDSNCTAIISALTSLGVERIDFIVLSHYHIDHITKSITSALNHLSASFDMSDVTIYLPHKGIDWTRFGDVSENKSAVESQVIDYITNKDWTYIQPNNKDKAILSDNLTMGFYNIGNYEDYYDYTKNESQLPHKINDVVQINYNAFSMIVDVISHGKHIVIPADCPYIALDKCVNDIEGCDVYAVEHHGLERKASDDWLMRINPKVSIVFSYSQPTTDDEYTNIPTIMSLALRSSIFTTIDGDIVLTTSIDGMSITANIPTVNYRASALENGAHHDSVIDAFLSSYQSQAVNIQGSNTYVEMVGKYVEVNGIVYFSAINHYKKNVSSGSGGVSIASNLPAPYDESIRFVEKDCFGNFTPTRIYYNSAWRTIGSGESGNYKLVRGYYKTGV